MLITMLMSILQDFGTYNGVSLIPYMGCLISTLIGTHKLCSLVISMLMSILQDFCTYIGVLMRIPIWGVS
jgi:hypothetical protein